MKQFTIDEINKELNGTVTGNLTVLIIGVEQISEAIENQMTFIGEKKYIKLWDQSKGRWLSPVTGWPRLGQDPPDRYRRSWRRRRDWRRQLC